MSRTVTLLILVAVGSQLRAEQQQQQRADAPPPRAAAQADRIQVRAARRLKSQHLPNPIQLHSQVISGGLPDGDAAFQELQSWGVKTVISVDAAQPDVAAAKKYGLRYVHLPHGYDGVPNERVLELAKAIRELDGPVYIHCHHGKHRSPAAASVACVAAGLIPPGEALAILELAGTSPAYRGLYNSAREAARLDDAQLEAHRVEFRETVDVPPLAEAMVAIERTHDRLKKVAAAGWRAPKDHPDLEPVHEALLLREQFTELLRTDDVQRKSVPFRQSLRESVMQCQLLEDTLTRWKTMAPDSNPPAALDHISRRIDANCKLCHQQFRDVPLGAK